MATYIVKLVKGWWGDLSHPSPRPQTKLNCNTRQPKKYCQQIDDWQQKTSQIFDLQKLSMMEPPF